MLYCDLAGGYLQACLLYKGMGASGSAYNVIVHNITHYSVVHYIIHYSSLSYYSSLSCLSYYSTFIL